VGVLAAFGAIVFQLAVDYCKWLFLGRVVGLSLHGPAGEISLFHSEPTTFHWYLLVFVPTLGGLVSGILVYLFAPEAKGHGTDGVIESYHFKRGIIRPIVPIIKTIASAITIGSGGSAGKEGPIAQIAAGIASYIGTKFGLNSRQLRIMVVAGLAAGIGATFRAPLAAGLFAAEVLYREMDFDRDVIMPSLISPIIAYAVFTSIFEAGPLFNTPNLAFEHSWELLPYTVVAILAGLGARGFVYLFNKSEEIFDNMKIPEWSKPAVGGFLVGLIGLVAPRALSESYGMLQEAHYNSLGLWVIALLAVAKALTTSLTIGSGGSGGVFGPSIVIGGLIGGFIGIIVNSMTPISHSAYVIVGMAGFFSAAANTPISTIFMVSEMTGSYSLLVPTMWVSTIAYILGRGATLYKKQLWNHFEAPIELGELRANILKKMVVSGTCSNAYALKLVEENINISELDEREISQQRLFGVVNKKNQFIGEIRRESIRYAKNQSHYEGIIAADIMERSETVTREDTLWRAMQLMMDQKKDRLFVVDRQNKPVSMILKHDITAAYDRRINGIEQEDPQETSQSPDQNKPFQIHEEIVKVDYDVDCTSQEQILRYLANLVAPGSDKAASKYLISLKEREELGSTAVGHGVAFPHPHQRELVDRHQGIYIIRTREALDFQSPDQQGVDTFILFWFASAVKHIDALAQIAGIVADGRLKSWLDQRESRETIVQHLIPDKQDDPEQATAGENNL
jgi:CIC family chloride channel protein